jgi:hypothetical protein
MFLSKQDIIEMNKQYVEVNYTETYRNKYVPLPSKLDNLDWKWKGKAFPRVISLLEFREYMIEYNKIFDCVVSFSGGNDPEYLYLNYKKCCNYNYEENEEYDLHIIDLDKRDFDFVLLNQVLEHLYNPIQALKNIYNHMQIGGMLYVNVPVNEVLHSLPFQFYTGYTPIGLGTVIKLAGFDILKIGQWGNKMYLKKTWDNMWPDYTYSDTSGI